MSAALLPRQTAFTRSEEEGCWGKMNSVARKWRSKEPDPTIVGATVLRHNAEIDFEDRDISTTVVLPPQTGFTDTVQASGLHNPPAPFVQSMFKIQMGS